VKPFLFFCVLVAWLVLSSDLVSCYMFLNCKLVFPGFGLVSVNVRPGLLGQLGQTKFAMM
jgi:hypothetical protein